MNTTKNTQRKVDFKTVTTHEELISATSEYISKVINKYDMDIEEKFITDISVTTQKKRSAAHKKSSKLSSFRVGRFIDWDSIDYSKYEGIDDFRNCELVFSWQAFEEFDIDTFKGIIRHELIHVEEVHKYGVSNHGFRFESRARDINAPMDIDQFTPYKYKLYCKECGEFVDGRYRKSKVVKNPDKYLSNCCKENLTVEEK